MIPNQTTWTSQSPPVPTALCNGCLKLIDGEWEPTVRIDQYVFHEGCAPRCHLCGGALERSEAGVVTSCVVVDSEVEFVAHRGYQVRLTVVCCSDCDDKALRSGPNALD
ncbi:MAG TPA: hypothetical protein VFX49_06560 [Chloroflexota bacterium]|nr:hypothetical protein [Chloroflexota bacterium]